MALGRKLAVLPTRVRLAARAGSRECPATTRRTDHHARGGARGRSSDRPSNWPALRQCIRSRVFVERPPNRAVERTACRTVRALSDLCPPTYASVISWITRRHCLLWSGCFKASGPPTTALLAQETHTKTSWPIQTAVNCRSEWWRFWAPSRAGSLHSKLIQSQHTSISLRGSVAAWWLRKFGVTASVRVSYQPSKMWPAISASRPYTPARALRIACSYVKAGGSWKLSNTTVRRFLSMKRRSDKAFAARGSDGHDRGQNWVSRTMRS